MDQAQIRSQASLVADALVFKNNFKELLLIKRGKEPFKDMWAFPGGRIESNERIEDGAYRELQEETNISNIILHQIDIADEVNRDPRGRTISIIYYGKINEKEAQYAKSGDDAKELQWFLINNLPELAFDHKEIIDRVIKKITRN